MIAALLLGGLWSGVVAQDKVVKLKIVETSDVHGNFYPYDFIRRQPASGSLARVQAFVRQERQRYGDNLILLDNGDILQGQPSAYYYNYMDTVSPHLTAEMQNYMDYDAGTVGNHDIETGRAVFDRWAADCRFPVLGANVIDRSTGRPHFKPYVMLEREGVRIAILGMITPAIPMWLSENLWPGLSFEDMEATARRWMPVLREQEKPDLIIGPFHAGKNAVLMGGKYRDNASVEVACNVPGFDVVLAGHDHARACFQVANADGDSVWVVNPANNAVTVGDVEVTLTLQDGKVTGKRVESRLTDVGALEPDRDFMAHFSAQHDTIQAFVSKKIGRFTRSISTRPAYFGPSAFVDLIHRLQLEIGQAEISLAAPLSFDARIEEGDICVSDMFNLYKYENMLYTMLLTGREVKDYLEYSYTLWTNRMQTPADHIMLLAPLDNAGTRYGFRNFAFNFDSAAGICYTVDVTRPQGEKITITSMADGRPFDTAATYRVAINSYRGNGGGELLTIGAGIPKEELATRIVEITPKDLRYYLMKYIERQGTVSPKPLNQWKFIPEAWTGPAIERDRKLLFGK